VEASSDGDLQADTQKTKHTVMPRHQNARQNHNLLTANKSYEMGQSSYTWE